METPYPVHEIETRWQRYWESHGLHSTDLTQSTKKLYSLVMFPYPSGEKLHIGHWYNYGPADTWARFQRMQGYNVFEPIGFDAFGLPAENYAIQTGEHPRKVTQANIAYMKGQLRAMGTMYDWGRTIVTSDPEYYRWSQWLFLQLYHRDLAYRSTAPVNWCPQCATVLANEQVIHNHCERCQSEITKKDLEQWFFRITAYADRLLNDLDGLRWPDKTKRMQANWIGRSEGAKILFPLHEGDEAIEVFTTRADTLYGATYLVRRCTYQPEASFAFSRGRMGHPDSWRLRTGESTRMSRQRCPSCRLPAALRFRRMDMLCS